MIRILYLFFVFFRYPGTGPERTRATIFSFFGGLQKLEEYILNLTTYYLVNYSNFSCFSTFSNILELAQGEPGILLKKIKKNGGLQKVKKF